MSGDQKDYEVGHGKPPQHTRFQKGRSGNPKGRPRGRRNFSKEIDEVLTARVVVSEHGRPRKVSSRMATLMRLREKALKGDGRAMDRLLELASQNELASQAVQAERLLSTTDEVILERYGQSLMQQSTDTLQDDSDVE
jgi:hypothetical protein